MMIHPVVAVAATSQRGQVERVGPQHCPGCGCCEVTTSDKKCCCCSGADDSLSDSDRTAATQSETTIREICLCGLTVPPMHHGEQNPDRFVVRHVELTCSLGAGADAGRQCRFRIQLDSLSEQLSNPRYSQRFLCVWRI